MIEWDQSDIKLVKDYLHNLQGSTVLTFEETTNSQWLYIDLNDIVDRIIVCDPYRLLEDVYHNNEQLISIPLFTKRLHGSGESWRADSEPHGALYRGRGLHHKKCDTGEAEHKIAQHPLRKFVAD